MPKVNYGGWPNCVRLANKEIELIVTTDVGPRVIRLGFTGGQNLLKEVAEEMGKTGGDQWRPYGGHRFWHAPEAAPRSYAPDNDPVECREDAYRVKLVQPVEGTTGMQKEIEITLDAKRNHVGVLHRLVNHNLWAVEAAPWALTVMAPGGAAVFPHEPYKPHPEYLLPARPLVVWHYTDMSDPRFTWGKKYIVLRQDAKGKTKNKVGMRNCQGWAAYLLKGDVFVKRFPFVDGAHYPDFGCNCECYTDPDIIEIESLGPLSTIEPGGTLEHIEDWYLFKADIELTEKAFDSKLIPLVSGVLG